MGKHDALLLVNCLDCIIEVLYLCTMLIFDCFAGNVGFYQLTIPMMILDEGMTSLNEILELTDN